MTIKFGELEYIKATSKNGREFNLFPVKMSIMPSQSNTNWLRFLGNHIMNGKLDEAQITALQNFMRKHKTEALTDGRENYTIAGYGLATCFPEYFSK